VSYPSSGNTWIRYLIEGLTGYFSGSMYNDNVIGKKGKFFCIVKGGSMAKLVNVASFGLGGHGSYFDEELNCLTFSL
jgi:hypothetical protein